MKLDELQRLAEGAKQDFLAFDIPWPESPEDVMDLNPSRIVCEYFAAMSPYTAKKLIAVALEGLALVDDFDCHAEPKEVHARYVERLRTALEELK